MDIENMHPFCLPFGFCHDATSSSIASTDFAQHSNGSNNNNNNIDQHSTTTTAGDRNKISSRRSKTSSPSDELFRHLNSATSSSATISHQSILNGDDLIIESSSSVGGCGLDIVGEPFYSLELDIDIDASGGDDDVTSHNKQTDIGAGFGSDNDNAADEDDVDDDDATLKGHDDDVVDDDWFGVGQYSLFSPTGHHHNHHHHLHHHGGGAHSAAHNSSIRRKSLINRMALLTNHNQVFQHVVDPIDIKSSPTLAQLNLNSSDDPTDGLWDTTTGATTPTGACSASGGAGAASGNHHSDLLSNCTSINHHVNHLHHHHHGAANHHHHACGNGGNTCSGISVTTCNHLSHQHNHHHHQNHAHHTHHHHSLTSPYSSHQTLGSSNSPATATSSPSHCHHVSHHHHHNLQSRYGAGGGHTHNHTSHNHNYHHHHHNSATTHSTCLAVAPFRKPDLHHHHHHSHNNQYSPTSHCCPVQSSQNLLTTATGSSNLNLGPNLKPSATLNQLNQLEPNQLSHGSNRQQQLEGMANAKHGQKLNPQQHHHQRSASPALVTSSSSPHALSALNVSSAAASENNNRLIDNKLKENIDYLTALLCNGNKLDGGTGTGANGDQPQQQLRNQQQHQQQPTISSTMARSYATLAHTLSTGPKLLERQQQQLPATANATQPETKPILQQKQTSAGCNPTNEAASCMEQQINNQQQQQPGSQPQTNPLKRPYSSDQWFKLAAVESSISAADSTGESAVCSSERAAGQLHHQCPAQLSPCPGHHQHLNCTAASALAAAGQSHKSCELKVLSSLLSASKCGDSGPAAGQIASCGANLLALSGGGHHHQSSGHSCASTAGWTERAICGAQQPISQPGSNQVPPACAPLEPHHHNHHQQQLKSLAGQECATPATGAPINGKPITLTPIAASNTNLIHIQQQHQSGGSSSQKPSRSSSLFAQPASPSASSTASSGANTDIGSSSSSSTAATGSSSVKRQRGNNSGCNSATHGNPQQSSSVHKAASGRAGRPNSMSTDCSLSSHDEGFSSQIDNDDCGGDSDDDDDDVDSDDESFYGDYTNSDLIGASISDNAENKWTLNMGRTRRNGQKRYFWQYNVQSKGPKGTRICATDDPEDPFVLPEASDPVFSNDCQVEGVKHSGKARRGDGNDLTPNPRKLLMIGLELKKLGKIINDLAPVTDLPVNARNKTRKEKNKLASRACRLKKKAQHEANKIKLYGLQREHQQVVLAIYDIRKLLNETLLERDQTKEQQSRKNNGGAGSQQSSATAEQQQQQQQQQEQSSGAVAKGLAGATINNGNVNSSVQAIAEQCSMNVAGQTSDYVNSVLEKVVSGFIDGGLQT